MEFRIADPIFDAFPEVEIGIVTAWRINNQGEHPAVMAALRNEEDRVRQLFQNASISDHPLIASWRDAYRKFGAKPKDYPSSIENLLRRVAKGHVVPHINTLVDIYNTISLRHILPVGGENLDVIRGDIVLDFAGENETPVRLLGEKEDRAPRKGEIIYKDDVGAICRRWNWKEADRTKLTGETSNAVLVIEKLPPATHELLEQAIQELAVSIEQHCGGMLQTAILNSSCRVQQLDEKHQ